MNYEATNIIGKLVSTIHNYITIRQIKNVVWLGVHPWLPMIIDLCLDLGVVDITIIDNDEKKQGILIYPYRCPNESFKVRGVEAIKAITKDTAIFMANQHYDEFRIQIKELGINNEIIDLYSDTLCEQTFLDNGIKNAKKNELKRLSGKEIQKKGFAILKRFREICDTRGLRYWLAAGTMLGAVRHGGFIPWDDDIDVEMPYEDYMALINNPPIDNHYYLLNWRLQDDYALTFSKFVDKSTLLIHDRLFPNVYKMGCYVDIFPVGGYPKNKRLIEEKWLIDDYRDRCWNYYYASREIMGEDIRNEIEKQKFSISFDEAEQVGGMHRVAQKRWCLSKNSMDSTIEVKFENEFFPIPKGYDEYLTIRYGNYHKVPSVDNQIMHSFNTYEI